MVHRRGEHFPDCSPRGQHPDQGLGWQCRSVKAKASALQAALTLRLDGRGRGAFFLLPAMQATSTLLRSSSTRQRKPAPAVQQLVLFSLPEPIGSCWDLICPEQAWEPPLRWAV